MKRLRFLVIAVIVATVYVCRFAPGVKAQTSTNLSAYEFLLGTKCMIGELAGTCGVAFGGWMGGLGPVDNGWTPFPGNKGGAMGRGY